MEVVLEMCPILSISMPCSWASFARLTPSKESEIKMGLSRAWVSKEGGDFQIIFRPSNNPLIPLAEQS